MDIRRRKLLKGMGGLAASMSLPMAWLPRSASAAIVPAQKKLVVLILNGGNDGINTVIPTSATQYGYYQGLRPTIQIPMADILPFGTTQNGVDMGLHPAMSSLMPLSNKLAIFPATHSGPNSSRSHFFQFDFYDDGRYVNVPNAFDGKGWLGRYLDKRYVTAPEGIANIDFNTVRKHMRGSHPVLSLANPSNVDLGAPTPADADNIFTDVKLADSTTPGSVGGLYSASQIDLFEERLPRLESVNFGRVTDPSVNYPGGLGTNFKNAADMLLDLPELEIVSIKFGGFDLHSNEGASTGAQASRWQQISESLSAFYNDLSIAGPSIRDNTVVAIMTEFGRTADENGNGGTDHGNASSWMVFGESVIGGLYGDYPGLGPTELEGSSRFWLAETVDYRDILSEILGPAHLGLSAADANSAFTGYTGAATPLGFMI